MGSLLGGSKPSSVQPQVVETPKASDAEIQDKKKKQRLRAADEIGREKTILTKAADEAAQAAAGGKKYLGE
jgi:hypothetical protein